MKVLSNSSTAPDRLRKKEPSKDVKELAMTRIEALFTLTLEDSSKLT